MTKQATKTKMSIDRKAYEAVMRKIDFQVDTVSVENANHTGGYFTPNRNAITVNYIPGNTKWNEWTESENVAIHEQKHRDNASQGFYAYAVSPEQAYKREMHDEISANMASLIALRQRYLETGDLSLFDRVEDGRFAFYKQAIEKGEIKPNSPYQEDFDKEMRLIVNGTQKMWMEDFGNGSYIDNGTYHYLKEGDFEGKYAAYWDENYQNALKIAYNIGGVDFTKYIDKDVEMPENANAEIMKNLTKYDSYYKTENPTLSDETINRIVFERSGLPAYDGSISLSQYKKLLQHQTAVNNFASGNSYSHEDGSVTVYSPQEYLKKLNSRETIEEYRKFYNDFTDPKVEGSDEAKKEFPTFESYRRYRQDFYAKDYNEKFSSTCGDEKFIDKMVEYQAQEYAKTGKDFPKDNPENYQKALNKMYCGAYEILKPDETKLKSELSNSAEKLQNSSAWERTMENYLKSVGVSPEVAEYKAHNLAKENKIIGGWGCFVGGPFLGACNKVKDLKHRMTHITDENGEEKNVGLWGKIKHKAQKFKEDLTTIRAKDENGKEQRKKCSVWKGMWNKISDSFGLGKGKLVAGAEIKNTPIAPANTKQPQYREWKNEDGSRVSPVQHREILDMRKSIIKRPIASREAMQGKDKSSLKGKMQNDSANMVKRQTKIEKKAEIKGVDTLTQLRRLFGLSRD